MSKKTQTKFILIIEDNADSVFDEYDSLDKAEMAARELLEDDGAEGPVSIFQRVAVVDIVKTTSVHVTSCLKDKS